MPWQELYDKMMSHVSSHQFNFFWGCEYFNFVLYLGEKEEEHDRHEESFSLLYLIWKI